MKAKPSRQKAIIFLLFAAILFQWETRGAETYSLFRLGMYSYEGDLFEDSPAPYVTLYRAGGDLPARELSVTISETVDRYTRMTSAAANVDFEPGTVTARFAAGQTSVRIPVRILNDAEVEDREVIGISFPSSAEDPTPVEVIVAILDNDFNYLPVRPVCAEFGGWLVDFLPVENNKVLVALQVGDNPGMYVVRRILADGTTDPSFAELTGLPTARLHRGPGDTIAVVGSVGYAGWLRLMRRDGGWDPTFATYDAEAYIAGIAPTADGSLYAALYPSANTSRVVKLRRNGTLDETFDMPLIEAQISSLAVTDDGGVLISAPTAFQVNGVPRQFAKLQANGAFDESFRSEAFVSGLRKLSGRIFGTANGRIVRLLPGGEIDPEFISMPAGMVSVLLNDSQGRLITIRLRGSGSYLVDRYLSTGARDLNYAGGLFSANNPIYNYAMANDETLLALGNLSEINGIQLRCGNRPAEMAHLSLGFPVGQLMVSPVSTRLDEEDFGAGTIEVVRTGDNRSPAGPLRYRVRSGTATVGGDVAVSEEGELSFAAGVSRAAIPVTVTDDDEVERPEFFFVEFIAANGEVASASEVAIFGSDIALKVVRQISPTELELQAMTTDGLGYFDVFGSADLENWTFVTSAFSESPFRVTMAAPHRFFRLRNSYD